MFLHQKPSLVNYLLQWYTYSSNHIYKQKIRYLTPTQTDWLHLGFNFFIHHDVSRKFDSGKRCKPFNDVANVMSRRSSVTGTAVKRTGKTFQTLSHQTFSAIEFHHWSQPENMFYVTVSSVGARRRRGCRVETPGPLVRKMFYSAQKKKTKQHTKILFSTQPHHIKKK